MFKKNICISFDSNFLQHAMVMLESLMHNSGSNFIFHIIVEDAKHKGLKKLVDFIEKRGGKSNLYEFNLDFIEGSGGIGGHLTLAALNRLLLPSILPLDIEKILYLDCDIIILEDINDLYNIDLRDFDFAGVNYVDMPTERPWSTYTGMDLNSIRVKLGLSSEEDYVNSGVLLINLEKWRSKQYEKFFIDVIDKESHLLSTADQCIINKVCKDKYILDWSYNAMTTRGNELIYGSLDGIKIAHSIGRNKPWNNAQHPMKNLYFHYLSLAFCKEKYWIIYDYTILKCNEFYKKNQFSKIFKEILFLIGFPSHPKLSVRLFYNFTNRYE
jgi:lipopolysaccharide biosynthesis glycosyltransferase